MSYGYIGSMMAKPGKRDEVIAIMLSGVEGLRSAGCLQYTVGASADDHVTIWTCEVWGTKDEHDASLRLPEAKESIDRAMSLLAGDFTRVETDVRGGLGLLVLPFGRCT
jgi:quinol monooxygenase YgiN